MRHRNLCTTEEENNNKTKSQESSHGSEDPDGGCEVPPALSSRDQGVLAQHHASCRRAQFHLCLFPSHSLPAPPALAEPAGPTRSRAPAAKTKATLFSRQISEDRRRPCPSRTGRGHTGAQHSPPSHAEQPPQPQHAQHPSRVVELGAAGHVLCLPQLGLAETQQFKEQRKSNSRR